MTRYRVALWVLLGGKLLGAWGLTWDMSPVKVSPTSCSTVVSALTTAPGHQCPPIAVLDFEHLPTSLISDYALRNAGHHRHFWIRIEILVKIKV